MSSTRDGSIESAPLIPRTDRRFERLLEAPGLVAVAILVAAFSLTACVGSSPNTDAGDTGVTEDAREAGPKCPAVDVGYCGNGYCDDQVACGTPETPESCPQDCVDAGCTRCADTGTCGDGICNRKEDATTCPRDCGEPDASGDVDETSDDTSDATDLGDTSDSADTADGQ